ncbi:MAG TPA: hypothetical protein VN668_07675 [Stellaceae bacterium]|nr:hypothetical protein [Stellaceae bacterium]
MRLRHNGLIALGTALLAGCVYYAPAPPVTYAYVPCGRGASPPPPPPGAVPPAAAQSGEQCVVPVQGYYPHPAYPYPNGWPGYAPF